MCNTKPFIFSVWCLKSNTIRIIHLSNSEICDIEYDEVNKEILYSYDIIFPTNVVHFVPEPIKYELSLLQCTGPLNYCVYNPFVYAFYLMFEITRTKNEHMSVKNEILRKLSTFIKKCDNRNERHRAYSLLGYCYYVCGRIDDAFDTFCLSMQEKADSKNIAVYHLCILLSEHVTSKTV